MASLEDFDSQQTAPSLEDFAVSKDEAAPVVSRASNLNIAAYSAAVSADPSSVIDTYRQVASELDTTGKSGLADYLASEARQRAKQGNMKALTNLLADPSVPVEYKEMAALQTLDDTGEQYEVRNLLSLEALAAPVQNESPRAEGQRVDTAAIITRVNEYKRQEQALLNSELNKEDPGAIQQVGNVLEYLLPFVESKMAGEVLDGMRGGDVTAYAQALALLGESKTEMRELLHSIPVEQRLEFTEQVVQLISSASGIVLSDSNDFARKDYLQSVLSDGYYDTADRWIDNVVSILDMTGLGAVVGRPLAAASRSARIADMASNVRRRVVKTEVQPSTISQNYKDTNPEKARAAHDVAVSDMTDEASEALYGASREDAIANDILPEIGRTDGSVSNKVADIDKGVETPSVDMNLVDFADKDGALYLWKEEKELATALLVNRMKDVTEMSPRKEMFQVMETGEGAMVRAVYGPTDGGFTSAEEAIDLADWALRDIGVPKDKIGLMVRDGSDYRSVTQEELASIPDLAKKDVLVTVDYNYKVAPGDVADWAEADVKYNIFDRMPAFTEGVGSLQRHLVDAHSMLHPNITLGASVAVDRAAGLEKALLKNSEAFSTKFAKADKEMQAVMRDMINEANLKGKDFSYSEMVAAGLRDNEIAAMRSWREWWDTMYELENRDLVKSLRNRGFMEYVDKTSDTKLFARPVGRSQAGKVVSVYDPQTEEITRLTKEQVTELYDKGGTIARLRGPMKVGDDAVEDIIVKGDTGSYLKALSDDAKALNYRRGYYSVQYKDPHFIIEKVKNSKGEVLFERAVATAGTKKDAMALARAKAAEEGKVLDDDYYVRLDNRKQQIGDDSYWDLTQTSGRSAQRVRGKRLESADSNVLDPSMTNIMDPVESMVASARSISHRTSMRNMIETTKTRFMKQYEEFLPTDEFGQKVFPSSRKEVRYRGGKTEDSKKLADARTTHEYIKYLENGYINHIDEGWKASLKAIADIAGNKNLTYTEKAARWMGDSRGPSAMGKNLAFNLYLALNPIRQLIIQGHQAVQLLAFNPKWVVGPKSTPQISYFMAKQIGNDALANHFLKGTGWSKAEAEGAWKAFEQSGQVAAIDKQNLVRGSLLTLADQMEMGRSYTGKAFNIVTKPITWSRRIGFDAGEYVNTMTSWLAHYDDAARKGIDMSNSSALAEVAGRARNFTYNMNAAGDMPYNQNFLAAVFQFMQVPHKALTTITTNRALSPVQKARLVGFNAIMYTLPPAAMYSWFGENGLDVLPENTEARDAIVMGLEGYTLNKLLSLATGEETSIDFSGLSPFDMYGTMEFVGSLFTTDLGTIVASTPSGQLFFGNNPRLTNFAKSAARYFNLIDDYEDPTTFGQVALEFGKMASGFSNAFKAAYIMHYDRKMGTVNLTDRNVPTAEAVAIAMGFPSLNDAKRMYVSNELYEKSQEFEADVNKWYTENKRHLLSKYPGLQGAELAHMVPTEAMRVWGNGNARAMQIIRQNLLRDVQNGDARLLNRVIEQNGILDAKGFEDLIRNAPYESEEKRQKMLEVVNYVNSYRPEEEE